MNSETSSIGCWIRYLFQVEKNTGKILWKCTTFDCSRHRRPKATSPPKKSGTHQRLQTSKSSNHPTDWYREPPWCFSCTWQTLHISHTIPSGTLGLVGIFDETNLKPGVFLVFLACLPHKNLVKKSPPARLNVLFAWRLNSGQAVLLSPFVGPIQYEVQEKLMKYRGYTLEPLMDLA